jgi:tetratricopeptide (TPR) repeat protein
MVHVARGQRDRARSTLEAGVAAQAKRPTDARFPGAGLHWMLGLIALEAGDMQAAEAEFDREIAYQGSAMFADEFAMDAWSGRGFAHLGVEDYGPAVEMFENALARVPGHAKSLLGLAEARLRLGQRAESEQVAARAREAIEVLRASNRESEAAIATACGLALHGRAVDAILTLDELLMQAPPGHAGWTIPVEPFTRTLRAEAAFQSVLARLTARAR